MASRNSPLNAVFQPSSRLLRDLVLDYLLHHSYVKTARTFGIDSAGLVRSASGAECVTRSSLPENGQVDPEIAEDSVGSAMSLKDVGIPDETLRLAMLRQEIELQILSGHVEEATKLLNQYFPFVLQESDGDSLGPGLSTSSPLAPPSAQQTPHAKVHYTSQVSTKPTHISLNLRILAFIETARTVPLVYARDPQAAKSTRTFTSWSFSTERTSSSVNGTPPSSTSTPVSTSTSPPVLVEASHVNEDDTLSAKHTDLLHRAQRLYASVESLRDTRDRDIYRKELNSVGGLLAYRCPEESPMAKYMGQERREAVANQVNSAILYHLGQPAVSHIELFVRQTGATWSVMHDNNISMPPPSQRPVSLVPPSTCRETTPSSAPTKGSGKAEKVELELVPPFDMKQFLDER